MEILLFCKSSFFSSFHPFNSSHLATRNCVNKGLQMKGVMKNRFKCQTEVNSQKVLHKGSDKIKRGKVKNSHPHLHIHGCFDIALLKANHFQSFVLTKISKKCQLYYSNEKNITLGGLTHLNIQLKES